MLQNSGSIEVGGDLTIVGGEATEEDDTNPGQSPYAAAKWLIEALLSASLGGC